MKKFLLAGLLALLPLAAAAQGTTYSPSLGGGSSSGTFTVDVTIDSTLARLYFDDTNGFISRTAATNTMSFAPASGLVAMTLSTTRLGVIDGGSANLSAGGYASTTGIALGSDTAGATTFMVAGSARGGNGGVGHAIEVMGGGGSNATTGTSGGAVTVRGGTSFGTGSNVGGTLGLFGGLSSGTDTAGATTTIGGGRGTGAGAPGNVILQTSTALGSGTTAQTLTDRVTVSSTAVTSTLPYTGTSTGNSITLCNTADCTTNYETGVLTWDTNYFDLKTAKGGSGTARVLRLYSQGNTPIQTSSIQPMASDAYALGSASLLWTNAYVGRSVQGFKSKTITDASATGFVQIALLQTVGSNFTSGSILWQVHCDNGTATTYADRAGQTVFSCNNISGTEACVFDATAQQVTQAATYSLAAPAFTATGGTDTVTLNVNADCAGVTGPTNMYIHYRLDMLGVQAVTPL